MTRQTKSPIRDAQKLRAQAERGRQADELMNHPMLVEAFDILEKRIEEGWKNSSGEDRQARENAYQLHRNAKALRGILKTIMVQGQNAGSLLQLQEISGGESSS